MKTPIDSPQAQSTEPDGPVSGSMTRRRFAQATLGAAALAATGGVSAQEEPDYGGWFDDVSNYDGTVDMRGQDTVEVAVGAAGNGGQFAFDPPAVMVSPGTTVVWTWTGQGGPHNVVSDGDGPLDSGDPIPDEGTTYEYTFEAEGVYKYLCNPHSGLGMKGAVAVQSGEASQEGGGGGEGSGEGGEGQEAAEGGEGRTGEASGPLIALVAVIVMAFLSPLIFAAIMRRKARQTAAESPQRRSKQR